MSMTERYTLDWTRHDKTSHMHTQTLNVCSKTYQEQYVSMSSKGSPGLHLCTSVALREE